MTPLFLDTAAIKGVTTPALVLTTVRDAMIAHARGRATVPPPLHMQFPAADGDCHVKAGWVTGTPEFTVKIATGFYRNPDAGLPTNHGLVCVVSAQTGQVRAILNDRGMLTAWRTAASGALATHAMARPHAAIWPYSALENRLASRLNGWPAFARSTKCSSTAAPRTKPGRCAVFSTPLDSMPGRGGPGHRAPPQRSTKKKHQRTPPTVGEDGARA
ncbi:hypothetical protein ABT011_34685, partial [Streptomyces virginiae]